MYNLYEFVIAIVTWNHLKPLLSVKPHVNGKSKPFFDPVFARRSDAWRSNAVVGFGSCSNLAKYYRTLTSHSSREVWRSTPSPKSYQQQIYVPLLSTSRKQPVYRHSIGSHWKVLHPRQQTQPGLPFQTRRWWATPAWWSSTIRWTVMVSSDGGTPGNPVTSMCIAPPLRMARCCCAGIRSASTCLGGS